MAAPAMRANFACTACFIFRTVVHMRLVLGVKLVPGASVLMGWLNSEQQCACGTGSTLVEGHGCSVRRCALDLVGPPRPRSSFDATYSLLSRLFSHVV